MFETIMWIAAGVFIGYALSGTRKLARIRKMKKQMATASQQIEAGAQTIAKLHVDLAKERDKSRDLRRDLILWEQLAGEIGKRFMVVDKTFSTVPETGIELLKNYEAQINAANVLLDQDLRAKNGEDIPEMRDWMVKAQKFVELTSNQS